MSKTSETPDAEGQSQTIHYGWDGDRLVHVEDARQIRHTVYESGSFVPMVQLSRGKGARNIAQLTLGQKALNHLAPSQQDQMQAALKQALKVFDPQTASGLPQSAQSAMNTGWGPQMNQLVRQGYESLQAAQAEEEAKYPIEVRHIVCDHLGTPMALIDATGAHRGQITWAARYGAWGDVEVEYNPHQIEQPIRFQGQQLDEETGLHYNRFRYYDPAIGSYVTQDPIGLLGGVNSVRYAAANPVQNIDPMGLAECSCTNMTVKRKDANYWGAAKKAPGDNYGHWWMEIGSSESYGWWPSKNVGPGETLMGVPGDLNGQTTFGGTATRDPHHGDSADTSFNPKIYESWMDKAKSIFVGEKSCAQKCAEAEACFRKFAKEYSGDWSWRFGGGKNCHTFQEQGMAKCDLTE